MTDETADGAGDRGTPAGEAQPEAGDEEQPAAGDEEQPDASGPIRTLDPRIRWLWLGRVILGVAILAAVGTGIAQVVDPVATWMVAGVLLPLLVLGLAWALLRYRLWAFQFRADHLFLERGVYRNVETVVPYVRIQHVDTSRGPVERVLGLSTLVVYTAGSRGADVAIPGLPADEAEAMQTRVKELAIEAEGGEGL